MYAVFNCACSLAVVVLLINLSCCFFSPVGAHCNYLPTYHLPTIHTLTIPFLAIPPMFRTYCR
ncbi:hypothetical protein C8R46DRAFT_1056267 [Mycena filopes]|nr:hypothetical protein C8R46DRAFT_1056267 [Mycena filopes]